MKRLNMEEEPGKDHWKESSVAVVEKSSSHLMQFFLQKMKKLGTEIPDVVVASVDSSKMMHHSLEGGINYSRYY